LRFFVFLKHLI